MSRLSRLSRLSRFAGKVLSGIRTVASLSSEDIELNRYAGYLDDAYRAGVKEGMYKGIGNGMLFVCFYSSYALAFWFGTKQVHHCLIMSLHSLRYLLINSSDSSRYYNNMNSAVALVRAIL